MISYYFQFAVNLGRNVHFYVKTERRPGEEEPNFVGLTLVSRATFATPFCPPHTSLRRRHVPRATFVVSLANRARCEMPGTALGLSCHRGSSRSTGSGRPGDSTHDPNVQSKARSRPNDWSLSCRQHEKSTSRVRSPSRGLPRSARSIFFPTMDRRISSRHELLLALVLVRSSNGQGRASSWSTTRLTLE